MAAIECYLEDTVIDDNGKMLSGILVTCGFCEKSVELPGLDCPALRRKALQQLQHGCREPLARHVIPSDMTE